MQCCLYCKLPIEVVDAQPYNAAAFNVAGLACEARGGLHRRYKHSLIDLVVRSLAVSQVCCCECVDIFQHRWSCMRTFAVLAVNN